LKEKKEEEEEEEGGWVGRVSAMLRDAAEGVTLARLLMMRGTMAWG